MSAVQKDKLLLRRSASVAISACQQNENLHGAENLSASGICKSLQLIEKENGSRAAAAQPTKPRAELLRHSRRSCASWSKSGVCRSRPKWPSTPVGSETLEGSPRSLLSQHAPTMGCRLGATRANRRACPAPAGTKPPQPSASSWPPRRQRCRSSPRGPPRPRGPQHPRRRPLQPGWWGPR